MGTAVLSAQDYFASPYILLNHQFTNMIYKSTSRETLNHRNSTAGLLPVPSKHLLSHPSSSLARTSETESPSSLASRQTISPLHPPPPASNTVPISFSSIKLKTSRSASARLPNRSAQTSAGSGLSQERHNFSNTRLPFKVVQADGVVNGRACATRTVALLPSDGQFTKPSAVKSGVEKKRIGSERVGDFRKRAYSDTACRQENSGILRSPSVATVERKNVQGKEVGNRKSQRRNSTNNGSERAAVATATAEFTILQRPKNKEAADELIAKFFTNVDGPSSSIEILGSETQYNNCESALQTLNGQNYVLRKKDESFHASEAVAEVSVSPPLVKQSSISSYSDMEVDSMVGNERWAGPAYTNSPPPSAVPLPKFSKKQPRTFSLELSSVTHQLAETTSNQSLGDTTLRPRSSGSPCSVSPPHDQKGVWDVTFATKDLRRMLNLDSH